MSLTFVQRNVIHRIIHNKVPCKYNLNRVFNNQNGISEESRCPICQEAQDTVDHFFFLCSKKNPFGQNLIQEFLWPATTINSIKNAIYTLDFSNIRTQHEHYQLGSKLIIILALAEV
jgi:hypothetical protein